MVVGLMTEAAAMPETDTEKRERSPAITIAAILVPLIPVAYVLSSGPVVWLLHHGYIDRSMQDAIEWFYSPITTCLNATEIGSAVRRWWIGLWTYP
jgi:hypothetical protein